MEPADAADMISELSEEKAEAAIETRFRNRAALQIAIIAAVLAIGGLGGGNATDDMVANNIKASDSWSFYQAKTVRQTLYEVEADQLKASIASGTLAPAARAEAETRLKKYESTIARYDDEPDAKAPNDPTKGEGKKQLKARAQSYEDAFDVASNQDNNFDLAETALQLALVLGSVAILSLNRWILYASAALGVLGALLALNGFFLLVSLP
jgi:hypothetical protein